MLFQVDYLAAFLLTCRMPTLLEHPSPARIADIASTEQGALSCGLGVGVTGAADLEAIRGGDAFRVESRNHG